MRFSGTVSLRPVRMGFIVRPTDLATVRRIMRLCNCLWGGRYNPIIPYFDESPPRWIGRHQRAKGLDIARGYINFFEPDVLVEASAGMADDLGWSHDDRYLGQPRLVTLDELIQINSRKRAEFAAGQDIFDVIAYLYDQEYKYERRHKRPFVLWEPREHEAFFELFGGTYPADGPLTYIVDAYRDVFEPETLPTSSGSYLKFLKDEYSSPAWITRYGLAEAVSNRNEPTIFIFDSDDSEDLVDGWNHRLVQNNFLPVNLHWLSDHAEYLRARIKARHRPIPGNPFGTMFHTEVEFSRSISDETRNELVRRHFIGLPENSFFLRHYPVMWEVQKERFVSVERRIIVNAKSQSFDHEIDTDGYVRVPTLIPDFRDEGRSHTSSTWINVIQPSNDYRKEDVAVVFPTNLWKPGFPRLLTGEQLTVTREGWVIPQQYAIGYSLLRPLGGRDAVTDWFKLNKIKALPSEAGQVAAQVIAAAGHLHACGMFADRKTIELLNSMAESHSEQQRSGRRVDRMTPDRAKHRGKIQQHFSERAKRSFGYWNSLDFFLERSVFRAGLQVKCPTCAYNNWFDLDAISYKPTCTRCLNEFKLSQTPDSLRRYEWFYRVIGPFAAPDFVRGGYSVALTLRCMAERHSSELTWSTGLELAELDCEVDFAGWYRRGFIWTDKEREEPTFFIGESKSFGVDAFDKETVENLRKVAERFPGAYIIVSSLKMIVDYSPNEIRLLQELAEWGRARLNDGGLRNPLIILTGLELFSEHGITQAWKAAGEPASRFVQPAHVDLTDWYQLAEATQQRYLGLSAFYADFQAQRRARANLLRLLRRRIGSLELHANRMQLITVLKARSKIYIT